ncbi:MAG: hypothetical protein A3F83_02935 [Candidatus Glassbacteria bacterium RIFCSPLOWO2_12_FULL_58_11]|uniref:DUF7133 domain-containing protein n=1 Tax=Candidatus Glassbacteria bacterium RIFCSPLOWO2_12_FULL_58_11 TaxID=1817867 RepID=A0A1F5YYI9_9BACT|nr:MAG: hypothetical protein A3F83_02935 [Candidatus Glassbacteria bacterium RIFCSPLOWO2_12_FULL_58_11]
MFFSTLKLKPSRIQALAGIISLLLLQAATIGAKTLPLEKIKLPPGFRISLFADNVPGARSMALSPGGTLFVGSRDNAGRVYALLDRDGDYRAEEVHVIASGLNEPNGVAFREGALYVAEINRVLRYDGIEAHLADPPKPVTVFDKLPSDRHHGWKFIRFGPDGKLYIPIGAPCNICEPAPVYASINRIDADGTGFEKIAGGIRNTVGFDWHPSTHELWFTDNGRDYLGEDLPPEELNYAPKTGLHFGYPYRHGKDIIDPEFGSKGQGLVFIPPARELNPHAAALGMRFYLGGQFPSEYKQQIFIAEHGSWNRSKKIGYRVSLVRLEGSRAVSYESFAQGWLGPDESVWGRPVDLQELPDGSLLVSDDYAGAIYRISYQSPVKPAQGEPLKVSPGEKLELGVADSALIGGQFSYSWKVDDSAVPGAISAVFSLTVDNLPLGGHRVELTVEDKTAAKTYKFNWQVTVTGPSGLSCDFSGNGVVDVVDVIALLILGHSFPAEPRLDYNRDGRIGAEDALSLIRDMRDGNCPADTDTAGVRG